MYQINLAFQIISENCLYVAAVICGGLIYCLSLYTLLRKEQNKGFALLLPTLCTSWLLIVLLNKLFEDNSDNSILFIYGYTSYIVLGFITIALFSIYLSHRRVLNIKNLFKYIGVLVFSIILALISVIISFSLLFGFFCLAGGCKDGIISFVIIIGLILAPIVIFINALVLSYIYKRWLK